MSDTHPTAPAAAGKPAKPYPDFPLTPHPAGYWCKKIWGKLHYFGPWSDPDGALKKYLEQKEDLYAGRTPRADPAGLRVKDIANAYLIAKKDAVAAGELSPRPWRTIAPSWVCWSTAWASTNTSRPWIPRTSPR
jgi:hypothetical protein